MVTLRAGLALFCFVALCSGDGAVDKTPKVLICYWGAWSYYRPGEGKFAAENVDPNMCTHLVYTFAKLENGVIASYDPHLDLQDGGGHGMYKKFNDLKRVNPKLKTLIAIGGWNEGSIKYSEMASTAQGRQKFVQSVVDFLDRHNFDGLDMDWVFPTQRGGKEADKENLVLLLREMKDAFKVKNYLLTAVVSAVPSIIDSAYKVEELGKSLDLINIMSYDYSGAWERTTGHNSPLRVRKQDSTSLSVESSLNHWISKGADRRKLVLGMALYGRSFTLGDPNTNGFRAPATGPGPAGTFTREAGILGYNEVCKKLQSSSDWKVTRDPEVAAPVAVRDREWIGYDDAKSLTEKVRFAMSENLAGVMVWSIDTDDFRGDCKDGVNPLLNAVRSSLNLPKETPVAASAMQELQTTPKTDIADRAEPESTTASSLPQKHSGVFQCEKEGFNAHPQDQKKFYLCMPVDGKYVATVLQCPAETIFDAKARSCVVPSASSTIPSTTLRPESTTMTPGSSTISGHESVNSESPTCESQGLRADPADPKKFYSCVLGSNGRYSMFRLECGVGTVFEPNLGVCVHE